MPASRLPPDFATSAAYPLYAVDAVQDRGWVLHFEAGDYASAPFLDQRGLRPGMAGWDVGRAELNESQGTAGAAAIPVHWLFHIGHCGSTLASRLLDQVPGVLGLREPLPLLQLMHAPQPRAADWLATTVRLLGRGFADTRAVVVKPTSVVTADATRLLALSGGRACLLWIALDRWLAAMLRSDALVARALDDAALAERFRPSPLPPADGAARQLARYWLATQLHLASLSAAQPGRAIDAEFETLLAAPADATRRLARHFGLTAPDDLERRIETSGLMVRYAKDAAQPFDAATRRQELDDAYARSREAVDAGVQWAERALDPGDEHGLSARLRAQP